MRKSLLLFIIFCIPAGLINAQQIKAGPFEGRWVWDKRGGDEPGFIELFFFGNVVLGMDEEGEPSFEGGVFTHTGRTITVGDNDFVWEYRLSGNTLTITDEYKDSYSYTKTAMARSPLEGIWKQSGGSDYDPDADYYLLFTGDIMAVGDEDGYEGIKIEFRGKVFHPSRIYFGENVTEKDLATESVEYRVSGRTLTLIDPVGHEELLLTKVY